MRAPTESAPGTPPATAPGVPARNRALGANVWKSYVYCFLMDFSLTAPIWVLYLRDQRGFSLTQITLMEVPLFLLIAMSEIPTGAIADRFGRRVSLALAAAVLSISMFIYGVASSYLVILLSNLAWGLAFTLRSGADVALLYDSLKDQGREDEFQRVNERRTALGTLAALLGFLLGAPIAAASSYSTAILGSALLAAGALPLALAMKETERGRRAASVSYLATLASGARHAWRNPSLRYLFLFSGFIGAGAAAPLLLLQQPWLAAHGVEVAAMGIWQAGIYLAALLAALCAGWLIRRFGEPAAFALLPALLLVCGAVLGSAERLWAAGALIGIAAARGLYNPLLALYVNRRIESEHRATTLSAQSMVGNVVMASVWPLGGLVGDTLGLRTAFWAFAGGAAALAGCALALWWTVERRQGAACATRVA